MTIARNEVELDLGQDLQRSCLYPCDPPYGIVVLELLRNTENSCGTKIFDHALFWVECILNAPNVERMTKEENRSYNHRHPLIHVTRPIYFDEDQDHGSSLRRRGTSSSRREADRLDDIESDNSFTELIFE